MSKSMSYKSYFFIRKHQFLFNNFGQNQDSLHSLSSFHVKIFPVAETLLFILGSESGGGTGTERPRIPDGGNGHQPAERLGDSRS